jgi:hypothetical protein
MKLLVLTHLLLGSVGVFVGALLMTGKEREHEENIDERLADFHTERILVGLGSTAPAMKDSPRDRDAA